MHTIRHGLVCRASRGRVRVPAGAAQPNGAVAKTAFGVHKQAGKILEYGLLPAHVGGAGLHLLRGSNIFKRINPFA